MDNKQAFNTKARTAAEFVEKSHCTMHTYRTQNGCGKEIMRYESNPGSGFDKDVLPEEMSASVAEKIILTDSDNVVLLCDEKHHEALCLAPDKLLYYDTDPASPFLGEIRIEQHSPCEAITWMNWPQTFPISDSLIQRVEVNLTKSRSGSPRSNATGRLVTTAKGQQLTANTTAKSALPVYRMPRTRRPVADAVVREMKMMNPEAFAHYHVGDE